MSESVHGTLCQTLGGAALMVKVLSAELKAGNPVEAAQLDDVGDSLDRALDEARRFFSQLQPVTPGEDGLMTALFRLADETAKETPCESPTFGEQLIFKAITAIDEGMGSPVDVLSDRELEVLEKLGKGLTTREVADDLHLSPKTVETHRAHIKEKLKFKDATSMVRFAVDWVNSGQGDQAGGKAEEQLARATQPLRDSSAEL